MRIAYFSVSDQLGGSEVALVEMVRGVRRLRPSWNPLVILPGPGPLFERVERAGARPIVLPMPPSLARIGESAGADAGWSARARGAFALRCLSAAPALLQYQRQLARLLRQHAPDILHTNGLKAHVLGVRAAAGIATIWHLHEYVRRRPVTRRLLARHASRCSLVLANSESVADDVKKAVGAVPPVRVLHNAVDLQAFSPIGPIADLDSLAGLIASDRAVVRIGLVAAFGRWKGHDVFLRALAALPATLPIRGYVIGAPLYDTAGSQRAEAELRGLATSLGLEGRVGFTGYVAAAAAMRALDVVVHASTRPEPFGLVIAEAMASGRAVVTSALGGARELIDPERDAMTHTAGDPASLAAVLAQLVQDEPRRRAIGQRAQAAARTRFDPRRVAQALVDVYESLAHESGVGSRGTRVPAATTAP